MECKGQTRKTGMRHPPPLPQRMKVQPRRWHLSSFWTDGRLWTLRVCRVGKDIGVRRQSEQRHKMKMLCLYLEQQTNIVLNLTCDLLTQRQRNVPFFSFTSINLNLTLIPYAWWSVYYWALSSLPS